MYECVIDTGLILMILKCPFYILPPTCLWQLFLVELGNFWRCLLKSALSVQLVPSLSAAVFALMSGMTFPLDSAA